MNGKTEFNLAMIRAAVKAREVIERHNEMFKSVMEKVQEQNGKVQPEERNQAGVGQVSESGS